MSKIQDKANLVLNQVDFSSSTLPARRFVKPNYVPLPAEMIEGSYSPLNEIGTKLLDYCLAVNSMSTPNNEITISISEFLKQMKMSRGSTNYDSIIETVRRFKNNFDIVLKNSTKDKALILTTIDSVALDFTADKMTFTISSSYTNMVKENKKGTYFKPFKVTSSLKSPYSHRLDAFIMKKSYLAGKNDNLKFEWYVDINLDEYRTMLQLEDKYQDQSDFFRNVVKIPISELNNNSDIDYTVTKVESFKTGRRLSDVRIYAQLKIDKLESELNPYITALSVNNSFKDLRKNLFLKKTVFLSNLNKLNANDSRFNLKLDDIQVNDENFQSFILLCTEAYITSFIKEE